MRSNVVVEETVSKLEREEMVVACGTHQAQKEKLEALQSLSSWLSNLPQISEPRHGWNNLSKSNYAIIPRIVISQSVVIQRLKLCALKVLEHRSPSVNTSKSFKRLPELRNHVLITQSICKSCKATGFNVVAHKAAQRSCWKGFFSQLE